VQRTKANVNVSVNVEVLHPEPSQTGVLLPWKLLRVDVMNLTTEVSDWLQQAWTIKGIVCLAVKVYWTTEDIKCSHRS